jgi:predicted transposase YbfD/YdcC
MALFGKTKRAWLQTCLALPHGMPSHETCGRVFARLNPRRFQACFLSWTQAVAQLTQGALISLDGKTVKASFDRATAASPLHMLSAWCSEQGGLVRGQLTTDAKSNELTASPELLQLLAIKGCMVTIDAMGCQTAIARQSRDQEGDDLLALKRNHRKAYKAVAQYFQAHIEHQRAWRTRENFLDAFDDEHGRLVRRRVWTITDCAALPALATWPDLRTVVVVETMRTAHADAPTTSHDRCLLSSLRRSATTFMTMIRQHWPSEKRLHGSLEVTFKEDRCRIRKDHAAENMVALRHVALNLLRHEQAQPMSIRRKRLRCSLDEHYLLTVIAGAT